MSEPFFLRSKAIILSGMEYCSCCRVSVIQELFEALACRCPTRDHEQKRENRGVIKHLPKPTLFFFLNGNCARTYVCML